MHMTLRQLKLLRAVMLWVIVTSLTVVVGTICIYVLRDSHTPPLPIPTDVKVSDPLTCILVFTNKPSQYDHPAEYDGCMLKKRICSQPSGATSMIKEAC